MKKYSNTFHGILVIVMLAACNGGTTSNEDQEQISGEEKIRLLIDTDANNEIDDQHAIAYALLNGDVFEVEGITVNNTFNGEGIENQYREAVRVAKLCSVYPEMKVLKGATGTYEEIKDHLDEPDFDGKAAVDFIIERAQASGKELVLLPVGKLTNIALAIKKDPAIISRVKVVWLGSNYPEAGEYNLVNDTTAVNPVIESGVDFEMVTVRYGKPSGTAAVTTTREEIKDKMPGKGPGIDGPVTGRHGNSFTTFGDYSVSLFEHATMHGDPPSRSLFDMAAVAIVKNPQWADKVLIPAPRLQGEQWTEHPENSRKIHIWENFDKESIMEDFFDTMENYKVVETMD